MKEDLELYVIAVLEDFATEAELHDWLKAGTRKPPGTRKGPLGSDLLRHLYERTDALTLVVRAHLYVERLLDEILTRKLKNALVLLENRDFTFSMKVDVLRAANYLDRD